MDSEWSEQRQMYSLCMRFESPSKSLTEAGGSARSRLKPSSVRTNFCSASHRSRPSNHSD